MAPKDIEYQTRLIVSCLFEDVSIEDRGMVEPDGVGDDDEFDPVLIADKLREIADDFDEKMIQPLIKNIQQAAKKAAKDQVAMAFGDSVDSLCKSWVANSAEVTQEKQLLKASVALGQYVKRNCPDLIGAVQYAMTDFLSTRLGSWVMQQGGWDEVASQ